MFLFYLLFAKLQVCIVIHCKVVKRSYDTIVNVQDVTCILKHILMLCLVYPSLLHEKSYFCTILESFLEFNKRKKMTKSVKKDNQYEGLQMTLLYLPLKLVELHLTGLSYVVGRQTLYMANNLHR